jgi:2-methylcitrate dehydratase PrpD
MQYCVATALLKGRVTLDDFTDEKVNDVEVQDFLSKISLVHPKDLTGEFELLVQEVVIKLDNGKEYSCKVTKPKGEPENPMTEEQRLAKYRECARVCLSDEKIESSLELISNLETVENIGELMKVVGTAERSGADAC